MAELSKNEQDLLATELMSEGGATMDRAEFDALCSQLDEEHRAEVARFLRDLPGGASGDDRTEARD